MHNTLPATVHKTQTSIHSEDMVLYLEPILFLVITCALCNKSFAIHDYAHIFLFQVRSLFLKSVFFIRLSKTVIPSYRALVTVCLTNHGLFLNQHPAAEKSCPLFK